MNPSDYESIRVQQTYQTIEQHNLQELLKAVQLLREVSIKHPLNNFTQTQVQKFLARYPYI